MATPLVIVDGKNGQGKRISVSIDEALWSLYCASRGFSAQQARKDIKSRMQQDLVKNTYDVKRWIYTEIAQPALLENATANASQPIFASFKPTEAKEVAEAF